MWCVGCWRKGSRGLEGTVERGVVGWRKGIAGVSRIVGVVGCKVGLVFVEIGGAWEHMEVFFPQNPLVATLGTLNFDALLSYQTIFDEEDGLAIFAAYFHPKRTFDVGEEEPRSLGPLCRVVILCVLLRQRTTKRFHISTVVGMFATVQ